MAELTTRKTLHIQQKPYLAMRSFFTIDLSKFSSVTSQVEHAKEAKIMSLVDLLNASICPDFRALRSLILTGA